MGWRDSFLGQGRVWLTWAHACHALVSWGALDVACCFKASTRGGEGLSFTIFSGFGVTMVLFVSVLRFFFATFVFGCRWFTYGVIWGGGRGV